MIFFLLSLLMLLSSRAFIAYRLGRSAIITDGDAMGHLTYVKEYYRTGGRPIDLTYLYALDGPDYPNGFHKLFFLLKIPVPWLEKYGGYLPTLFDLLHLCLAGFVIYLLGGQYYEWLLLFPFLRVLWGNEGRSSHFSERAYGVLFANLYLVFVAVLYMTGDWWWGVLAILAFIVASISSKFAWQATAFFSILLPVATLSPFFILMYGLSVVLSFILTRGYSLHVLKGLLRHSAFYQQHMMSRNPSLRENYRELLDFKGGIKRYVYTVFTNSPLRIVSDFPIFIIIAWAAFFHQATDFWSLWVFAGVGLVILIATRPLKFLGEPERYLEFCLVPAFVFLSFLNPADYHVALGLCLLVIVGVLAFHVAFNLVARQKGWMQKTQQDMLSLREFFTGIERKRIITVPFRVSFFLGYENHKNQFMTLFSNVGTGEKKEEYRWLMKDRYPFMRGDIPAVIARYNLDYIVVHKSSVEFMNKTYEGGYYDLSPYKAVYENDSYAVYSVKT